MPELSRCDLCGAVLRVRQGHLVELGVSSTGARCYSIAGEVKP